MKRRRWRTEVWYDLPNPLTPFVQAIDAAMGAPVSRPPLVPWPVHVESHGRDARAVRRMFWHDCQALIGERYEVVAP